MNTEQREKMLNERERALNEKEKILYEQEKSLNEREKLLYEMEKKLNKKETKKPIVVSYTSNYDSDIKPNYQLIGTFTDEQVAINSVIPWLIKNQLGGFDCLADLFSDRIDDNDGEVPPELDFDPSEENFIKYYDNMCKSWDDLVQILDNDGDSYFRDCKGWNIHWN